MHTFDGATCQNSPSLVASFLARYKKKSNTVGKRTLGMVAGQFLSSTFSALDEADNVSEPSNEIHMSFRFRVEMEDADRRAIESAMAGLVSERNQLVHHFCSRIVPDELENWLEAACYLDKQRGKIVTELKALNNWAVSLKEGREELFNFLATEEGRRQFFWEVD